MKCYICAQEGKSSDAVAICIICGMGLCSEHVVREDIDVWEGDYPFPAHKGKVKLPRILCPDCYDALRGE